MRQVDSNGNNNNNHYHNNNNNDNNNNLSLFWSTYVQSKYQWLLNRFDFFIVGWSAKYDWSVADGSFTHFLMVPFFLSCGAMSCHSSKLLGMACWAVCDKVTRWDGPFGMATRSGRARKGMQAKDLDHEEMCWSVNIFLSGCKYFWTLHCFCSSLSCRRAPFAGPSGSRLQAESTSFV